MKKKILTVVGTRPNFIKITQFEKEFAKYPEEFEFKLLHTGQHYDKAMSKVFFEQLQLREPDYYLGIGAGAPGIQMGQIMVELTKVMQEWRPDLIVVVGDVNSTLAAAIAANKLGVRIAHLESGLRSRDRAMPEEINRILTDEITDVFFITEQSGTDNLQADGKAAEQLHFVGNTMIDTLVAFTPEIEASPVLEELGVKEGEYALLTMHRPRNVDFKEQLEKMIRMITFIGEKFPVVFPVHPRTRKRLEEHGLAAEFDAIPNLVQSGPMDYLGFQKLIAKSKVVVTDSGGIQEETTFRQVPCLTIRPNTERPSTITLGTNELLNFDVDIIEDRIGQIEAGTFKHGEVPPYWDGKATQRIVETLRRIL